MGIASSLPVRSGIDTGGVYDYCGFAKRPSESIGADGPVRLDCATERAQNHTIVSETGSSPVNLEQARIIAEQYVTAAGKRTGIEVVILDEYTIERPFGWVFFYDSKKHVESG